MSDSPDPKAVEEAELETAARVDRQIVAIGSFKDWSNYLLVTTVAALGWVATTEAGSWPLWLLRAISIVCLAFSVVFGIFTLAMIPAITERLKENSSFYTVPMKFDILQRKCRLFGWSWQTWVMRIKDACWFQHAFFLIGIATYAGYSLLPSESPSWQKQIAEIKRDINAMANSVGSVDTGVKSVSSDVKSIATDVDSLDQLKADVASLKKVASDIERALQSSGKSQ